MPQFLLAAAFCLLCSVTFPHAVPAQDERSAEIKLLVQSDKIEDARTSLRLAPAADKRYRIHFVDTADLQLIRLGLILRLREKGDGKTEATVKFRPPNATELPKTRWTARLEEELEWLIGKGENVSYSLKHVLEGTDLLEKPADNLATLFSAEQKTLFEELARREFDPSQLAVFGPIEADIWEWRDEAVDDKVSAELWKLAGEQILEVSRKAKASNLERKAQAFAAAFSGRVTVDPNPESKTRRALEFLKRP